MNLPPAPLVYLRETWQHILEILRRADDENLKNNRNIRLNSGVVQYIRQPDGTEVPMVIDNNGVWVTPSGSGSGVSDLATEILADNPTGYWKCNDSGSTLVDSSGNGFDMAVVGSPTMQHTFLVPTSTDKFMRFNASGQGGSITSALGTSPPLTGDYTVEAINICENSGGSNFAMFSLGLFSSELEALNLQAYFYRRTATAMGLAWLTENGAGADQVVNWNIGTTGLALLQPYHLVMVKDGTADTVTFYVGGVKTHTATVYTTEPSGGTGAITAKIGYDGTNAHTTGSIGHVAFYNGQKLSDERIWAHARAAGLAGIVASQN